MSGRRFPPELDPITANQPMTAEQAVTLRRLAEAAYELDAFKPNLTRAEADVRIAMLTAKLKLLDEPPHTAQLVPQSGTNLGHQIFWWPTADPPTL